MEEVVTVKQIKLKPILKDSFSGIYSHPRSSFTIGCEISGKTGLYKTGLTAKEAGEYEVALSLPKGTLSPNNAAFWVDIAIRLNRDKATLFTLDGPLAEIKYKVMLNSSKICPSEIEKYNYPDAYFMIVDEEATAKAEEQVIDLEMTGMELIIESDNKKGLLKLFGKTGVDKLSDSVVKTQLVKVMKDNPKEFIRTCKDKKIKTRILIEELLEAGILIKTGNYYKNGDDPIGNSTEEVIEYFDDLKHQSIKLALESKLKAYRKAN